MPWFKVDDNLAFHRKVVAAGNAAMGLWVRAGALCAQQLTDGFVPAHMAAVLGTPAQIKKLITVGLWTEVDGGYQFHQWSENGRQPDALSVRESRSKAASRQARWRAGKSDPSQVTGTRNAVSNAATNGATGAFVTGAPTRPVLGSNYLGGESLETYEVDQGENPPLPKIDPGNPRCADHVDVPAGQRGPNCGACADVRKRDEQQRRSGDLDRTLAARRCTWCDTDGWRIDPRNRHRGPLGPPGVRCDHTPLTDDQLERFAS